MNKRKLHHWLTVIKRIPNGALLGITVILIFISVFSLRANNQRMITLRNAVFTADQEAGDVEGALKELRQYVYSHMNTDLATGENSISPPIQLKYRYERLVAAEQSNKQTGGTDLYIQAQEYCERTQPGGFSGSNRLDCIREYLDARGVSTTQQVTIPDDMYKFDFASPAWSPDLAGLSLVAAGLSFTLLILRSGSEYLIKKQLKHYH